MIYDKERIYATKWQHVVETAVNDCRREIVENHLEESSLSTAQIAKVCGLEIEDVEEISRQLEDAKLS